MIPPVCSEVPFGLQIGGFISAFQAKEFSQGRSIPYLQTQGRIGWIVPLLFPLVIVIIAAQGEAAKNPLHSKGFTSFSDLPGFGLVGGIDLIGGLLEQVPHQFVGRFENSHANEWFQLLHG